MNTKTKKAYYNNGQLRYEHPYQNGKSHGVHKAWRENGELEYENYYLYGKEVSPEEYKKHELITQLSGLENEYGNQKRVL